MTRPPANMIFALLVLFICGNSVSGEFQLVWSDEFDTGRITDRWEFEWGCGGWGGNELQCYTNNRAENAKQENGVLTIKAIKEPWYSSGSNVRYNFTSARMKSKVSFLYGKIEARMRLPKGTHLLPAFWLRPRDRVYGSSPASGTMDVLIGKGQSTKEILGRIHYGPSGGGGSMTTNPMKFPVDLSEDWHDYQFSWSPHQVTWFVDGVPKHSISLERNFWPGFYTQAQQPFDQPFYITLNLAVGGMFFTDPFTDNMADSWTKSTLQVDHVRIYEWK